MYIESVPNRNSPPAILLRESFRVNGKVAKRTLANLSKWPPAIVEALRQLLRDPQSLLTEFSISRSLPHGHVAAVLGSLKKIGLDTLIYSTPSKLRSLLIALIVARIVDPASKLATARMLDSQSASTSLGNLCQLEAIHEKDLYEAMDWLLTRQGAIETKLAKKHLQEGSLVLYDVSSSYFEGTHCSLAKRGHNRDKKQGKLQIVYGLICSQEGCPVAIEVFEGNTADPNTFAHQIAKLRQRFALKEVVWVGDRGMITQARIDQELKGIEGLRWISALRHGSIKKLMEQKVIQLSLFDQKDLAEVQSQDYPDERLMVCFNPFLKEQRERTREQLLQKTRHQLDLIIQATQRKNRPLRGQHKIALRTGKMINRYKVAKHFKLTITDQTLSYELKTHPLEKERHTDGLYVIRTNVTQKAMDSQQVVEAYKNLSRVEQAFRSLKTVDLEIRPIYHYLDDRVRSHVFLCMLAYYVQWHMRQKLSSVLFEEEDQPQRSSPVAPAPRSEKARRKEQTKRTQEGWPVHSFRTLLRDLATVTQNTIEISLDQSPSFKKLTDPTPFQTHIMNLLELKF